MRTVFWLFYSIHSIVLQLNLLLLKYMYYNNLRQINSLFTQKRLWKLYSVINRILAFIMLSNLKFYISLNPYFKALNYLKFLFAMKVSYISKDYRIHTKSSQIWSIRKDFIISCAQISRSQTNGCKVHICGKSSSVWLIIIHIFRWESMCHWIEPFIGLSVDNRTIIYHHNASQYSISAIDWPDFDSRIFCETESVWCSREAKRLRKGWAQVLLMSRNSFNAYTRLAFDFERKHCIKVENFSIITSF